MNFDITKIANIIIYMLDNDVKYLNNKKLSILLFLMDFNHQKNCGKKIFADEYIKDSRHPEPKILGDIFDIILNEKDLDEEDERLYLIQEILDYLDIEIAKKSNYLELQFIKLEEEFDESLFEKEELKTINKIISKYKNETLRNCANATFKIDEVRMTQKNELII